MMDLRRWLWNEKGNVLLFTIVLVVPLMIIFGGLALDLAHLGTADNELQRSLDAAALAGAGKLGKNTSVWAAGRFPAQSYAFLNPVRLHRAPGYAPNVNPMPCNLSLNG